jgi:type VI secretion system secreted protein Hcp
MKPISHVLSPVIAVLLVAATVQIAAASRIYITIEGQKQGRFVSDSLTARNAGTEVLAVSFGVQSPRDRATGQASGRIQYAPLTITKEWGASSPQLFEALADNENLRNVLIQFTNTAANGREVPGQTIKLTDAQVCNIRQYMGVPPGGGPGELMFLEDISFVYRSIDTESAEGGRVIRGRSSVEAPNPGETGGKPASSNVLDRLHDIFRR